MMSRAGCSSPTPEVARRLLRERHQDIKIAKRIRRQPHRAGQAEHCGASCRRTTAVLKTVVAPIAAADCLA
jgi:hypothetical protein